VPPSLIEPSLLCYWPFSPPRDCCHKLSLQTLSEEQRFSSLDRPLWLLRALHFPDLGKGPLSRHRWFWVTPLWTWRAFRRCKSGCSSSPNGICFGATAAVFALSRARRSFLSTSSTPPCNPQSFFPPCGKSLSFPVLGKVGTGLRPTRTCRAVARPPPPL